MTLGSGRIRREGLMKYGTPNKTVYRRHADAGSYSWKRSMAKLRPRTEDLQDLLNIDTTGKPKLPGFLCLQC